MSPAASGARRKRYHMDNELDNIIKDSGNKTSCIFVDFMRRTTKLEELVAVGHRFFIGFCQELETFRRPQLCKTSSVVDDIIVANLTDRMKAYIEAGCRHPHLDIQNISKLHSCEQGLQDHLKKVGVLLDELKSLKEDAIDIAETVNHNASHFLDDLTYQVSPSEEDEEAPPHLQDKSILHATLMVAIYNMLRLDYDMQEKVIRSLSLKTLSSELESYCLMWDLRPYINDNVMHLAWRFIPG